MDFQSLVETRLEPVGKMNEEIIYRCPNCEGETGSGHLYVNYGKNKWHCFKCDAGGKSITGLLKLLNISTDYDYERLYMNPHKGLDDIISMKSPKKVDTRVVDYSTDLDTLTKYYLCHLQGLTPAGFDYLLKRGLTYQQITQLEIHEGRNRYGETITINGKEYIGRDYSGRIMIPSRRKDGLISFYVARDYIGDKPAKYLNPPKELVAASEDIWNLDMVDSESVIICEGVMTAIAASPYKFNAVATYGKSIAQNSSNDSGIRVTSQGEKLLNKKFKNYYIAYDADAHSEAIKSCEYLYSRGANVYLVLIDPKKYGPKADVADLGYEEFVRLMREAIHYQGGLSIL